MTREQAINYLRSSGFSDEQIDAVTMAFSEERKTGKWKTSSDFPDRLICSECSAQFDMWHWEAEQMHYCPNCGAEMKGGAE